MGWGLPFALAGLAFVGLPILIHLLRQRDLPLRTLPTVALLQRATAESQRRLRLRDRWLLALRALALAVLAMAVAEPFVVSERPFDDQRLASLVIVIDDSMSMGRTETGTTLLSTAVDRAVETVEGLAVGSEVGLILAGQPARVAVPRTTQRSAVLAALRRLPEVPGRGTDMANGIALARRALASGRHARRLWVLSDFAAHSGLSDARFPTEGVAVSLDRIGGEAPPNAAVMRVTAAPDPTRPGETSVRALLRGPPDTEVEVTVERESVLASADARFDERGSAQVTLHIVSGDDPGATVRIASNDALATDDTRGVLLHGAPAIEVLLVDGDPHPTRTRDEVGFLTRALDVAPRESGLRYRVIDAGSFDAQRLDEIDVVVLANVAAPYPAVARSLEAFVSRGGGLWITSGDQVQPRAYRARLGDLIPGTLGPALDTEGALEPAPEGLGNARVRRLLSLEPAVGSETRVSVGAHPLWVSAEKDEGRVAFWTTSIDDAWSELPYHPGFVATVSDLLRWLGAEAAPPPSQVLTGSIVSLGDVRVRTPDGEIVAPDEDGRFHDTEVPGVYRVLEDDDEIRFAMVVGAPSDESELQAAPLPDLNDDAHGSAGVVASRRPLGPWLFLLVGLLLFAEGVLRQRGRARVARSGTG